MSARPGAQAPDWRAAGPGPRRVQELGQAGLTKRPTSCMLVLPKPLKGELPADEEGKEYKESYEEVRGAPEAGGARWGGTPAWRVVVAGFVAGGSGQQLHTPVLDH